jgi:hypothetical protein
MRVLSLPTLLDHSCERGLHVPVDSRKTAPSQATFGPSGFQRTLAPLETQACLKGNIFTARLLKFRKSYCGKLVLITFRAQKWSTGNESNFNNFDDTKWEHSVQGTVLTTCWCETSNSGTHPATHLQPVLYQSREPSARTLRLRPKGRQISKFVLLPFFTSVASRGSKWS